MAEELTFSLRKRFPGGLELCCDGTLRMDAARVTVLFGASASGKTTLLRCLAGLDRPDDGRIAWDGETWLGRDVILPPQRRGIGYVTQESALFPHLSVRANVAFGAPGRENAGRVAEMLDLFDLAALAERRVAGLSGGEQQRVALARARARRPRLLLLDEPFSALDSPTRAQLRGELRERLRRLGIPVILVTHDRAEAMALADELLVVCSGKIVQRGPAMEVFNAPASAEVARLVGIETVLPARCESRADGLLHFRAGEGSLVALDSDAVRPGDEALLCIRAEDVILARHEDVDSSPRNRFAVRVESVEPEGGGLVRLALDAGFPLKALLTRQSCAELNLEPGARAWASVKAPHVHVIPRG
jgi:molybdate transport system ATP-binding protein